MNYEQCFLVHSFYCNYLMNSDCLYTNVLLYHGAYHMQMSYDELMGQWDANAYARTCACVYVHVRVHSAFTFLKCLSLKITKA